MNRKKELRRLLHVRLKVRPANERELRTELLQILVAEQALRLYEVRSYAKADVGLTLGVGVSTPCVAGDYRTALGSRPFKRAVLCHRCDNGDCANPEHLFWGTARDNMRDAVLKSRRKGKRTYAELVMYEETKLNSLIQQLEELCNNVQKNDGLSSSSVESSNDSLIVPRLL